jgi:glycine cleavage system transcriptional repressor
MSNPATPIMPAVPIMNTPASGECLVITAAGPDRVGLVDRFTARILDAGGNLEESRMVALSGQFALLVRVSGPWNALAKLEDQVMALGEELGLSIVAQRSRAQERGQALIPYRINAVAMDHPGIVHRLANFFAQRGINIEEVTTETYPAPHTGTPMFSVDMTVGIPADVHLSTLRGDFLDYCDSLNLDATLEPARA